MRFHPKRVFFIITTIKSREIFFKIGFVKSSNLEGKEQYKKVIGIRFSVVSLLPDGLSAFYLPEQLCYFFGSLNRRWEFVKAIARNFTSRQLIHTKIRG